MKLSTQNTYASAMAERTRDAEMNKAIFLINSTLPEVLQDITSRAEDGYSYLDIEIDENELNNLTESLERLGFRSGGNFDTYTADYCVIKKVFNYLHISWARPKKGIKNNLAQTMLDITKKAIENNKRSVSGELLPEILKRIEQASDKRLYFLRIYNNEMKPGQRGVLKRSLRKLGFATRCYWSDDALCVLWGPMVKQNKQELMIPHLAMSGFLFFILFAGFEKYLSYWIIPFFIAVYFLGKFIKEDFKWQN